MIELTQYLSPANETSVFKGLPMSLYTPEVRRALRAIVSKTTGKRTQFKFRGPRNTPLDLATRNRRNRQSGCTMTSATSFAVYTTAIGWRYR